MEIILNALVYLLVFSIASWFLSNLFDFKPQLFKTIVKKLVICNAAVFFTFFSITFSGSRIIEANERAVRVNELVEKGIKLEAMEDQLRALQMQKLFEEFVDQLEKRKEFEDYMYRNHKNV